MLVLGGVPSWELTAKAPENGCLEDDRFLLGAPSWQVLLLLVFQGFKRSSSKRPGKFWKKTRTLGNSESFDFPGVGAPEEAPEHRRLEPYLKRLIQQSFGCFFSWMFRFSVGKV